MERRETLEMTAVDGNGMKIHCESITPLEWALYNYSGNCRNIKLLVRKGVFVSKENFENPVMDKLIQIYKKEILIPIVMGKLNEKEKNISFSLSSLLCSLIDKDDFCSVEYICKTLKVKFNDMCHLPFIKCLEKGEYEIFLLLLEKTNTFDEVEDEDSISRITLAIISSGSNDLMEEFLKKVDVEELDVESYPYFIAKKEVELSDKPVGNTSGKPSDE
jgi:hypothetical protein